MLVFSCLINLISASPLSRWSADPNFLDIKSLDDELKQTYTIKCPLGDSIIMDKRSLKKSPVLEATFENDSTSEQVFINLTECNQETLELVMYFCFY